MHQHWHLAGRRYGFTLIELLVVIAIIGILSAVVLVALGVARDRGNDVAVLSNLSTVYTQAALYHTEMGTYGFFDDGAGAPDACPVGGGTTSVFDDETIQAAIVAAEQNSGGTSLCIADDVAETYSVAVSRPAGSASDVWCVDSDGTKCGVASGAEITAGLCTLPCVSNN